MNALALFNYDGVNDRLSAHNSVALPHWAAYFWAHCLPAARRLLGALISETPLAREFQKQSCYGWAHSKWADYRLPVTSIADGFICRRITWPETERRGLSHLEDSNRLAISGRDYTISLISLVWARIQSIFFFFKFCVLHSSFAEVTGIDNKLRCVKRLIENWPGWSNAVKLDT